MEEVTTGKPPDQDYFLVSPQVVRRPKQNYPSNFTENCLEEMMVSGSELEHTDWFTSQSKEGHGSSYKKRAVERGREE